MVLLVPKAFKAAQVSQELLDQQAQLEPLDHKAIKVFKDLLG
jgi:hypothetical protein